MCVCECMVLDTLVTKTSSALPHGKEGLSGKAHLSQKMLTLTSEKVMHAEDSQKGARDRP